MNLSELMGVAFESWEKAFVIVFTGVRDRFFSVCGSELNLSCLIACTLCFVHTLPLFIDIDRSNLI